MNESYQVLVRILLPEGILEYFELAKVVEAIPGLNIYLEEMNIIPVEYKDGSSEILGEDE